MAGHARPYRFGPRDRQGFVLGIRSGQLVLVALVLVLSVGELRSVRTPLRIPVVFAELTFGLAAAFVPVRGRTLEEWAPVVARYGSAALSGGHRRVQLPVGRSLRTPATFSGLSLVAVSGAGSPEIGAVHDRRLGTLTGVLSVGGESFALLDDDERDRRVAAWSAVLAAVGNGASPPHRLQWIQRTVPDRRSSIRERVERSARPASELPASELVASETLEIARRSYAAFVDAEASRALRHETLLVVSVRATRSRGARRRTEEAAPPRPGAAEELLRALTALRRRCSDAGIAVDGALSPDGLCATLRRSFERDDTASASLAWPVGCEESWSAVRTDGTWHTIFWVAEWPRSEVGSDFLLPLLLGADERRAVSIVMAPVEPGKAVHRAERARTTARADSELLRRHGFARTAQSAKQHESVERREEELASGHAGYRFSGYLLVTGVSEEDLERACARVEQAAAMSRLELYRLYGAQSEALLFGLPLGRGCP